MGWFPHPTEIRYREDEGILHMTFSDDHEADYPTVYLRGYCPCAHCQGHRAGPPRWVQPASAREVKVEDVTQVGNYAICIVWADGHDTGIYSFEQLREICPCPKCKPRGLPEKERTLPG